MSIAEVHDLEQEFTDLLAGRLLADPWPLWRRLREQHPVVRLGDVVIATRFADVKEMMTRPERFSNRFFVSGSRADAIVASLPPDVARMWREMAAFDSKTMTRNDDPAHDRLRGISHRFFTPKYVGDLEPAIQHFWDDILARAAEEGVYDHKYAVQDLALRVMAHVIGSPQVDRDHLAGLTARIARYLGTADPEIIRDAYGARQEFNAYIEDVIIGGYRRDPSSNELVATMMDAESADNLSPQELCAMVSLLLFGGVETTAVLLSSGLVEVLDTPDQWRAMCDDPGLVPGAVEEMFRYIAPAQWVNRVAREDFELEGVEIPAGQTMIGGVAAAHRDPSVYDDPERFDIHRRIRQQIGLGLGPHYCLGASLIRLEARIAFTTLAQRFPDLQMTVPSGDLDWSGSNPILRTVREMPVRLGPERRAA
jgi:cytochrome P450